MLLRAISIIVVVDIVVVVLYVWYVCVLSWVLMTKLTASRNRMYAFESSLFGERRTLSEALD